MSSLPPYVPDALYQLWTPETQEWLPVNWSEAAGCRTIPAWVTPYVKFPAGYPVEAESIRRLAEEGTGKPCQWGALLNLIGEGAHESL